MKKQTKQFVFDTPIVNDYKGAKHVGYARIFGKGYYHPNSHEAIEADDDVEALFTFDVEQVLTKYNGNEQDSTNAYRIAKDLSDTFADIIEKATMAHMSYLFQDEVNEHWGRNAEPKYNQMDDEGGYQSFIDHRITGETC